MNDAPRPRSHVPRMLYTVADAAFELSVSYRQMHRLLTAGEVPYVRVGRQRKVTHEALQRYIDSLAPKFEPRRGRTARPTPSVTAARRARSPRP